jgi:hypothetical protein
MVSEAEVNILLVEEEVSFVEVDIGIVVSKFKYQGFKY